MAAIQDVEIDFVIMWVDGADPVVAAEHASALTDERTRRKVTDAPNRHRDNGELVFLLRAIKAHMPWFRRIYIVTNGQRPAYVDSSSDSLRFASHRDFFPTEYETPSFNTFAIDSCLHEIDGLSEVFVRFSDDFFVGRSVPKRDFLGVGGLGRSLVGEIVFNRQPGFYYYESLQTNAVRFWEAFGYMPLYNPVHAPQLRRRSMMRRMVEQWPEWFAETRRNRFRSRLDANCLFLYPYFALFHDRKADLMELARNRDAPGIVRATVDKGGRRSLTMPQVMVGSSRDWRSALNRIVAEPPLYFNVNDDMPPFADKRDVAYVGERLCRLFRQASPWETNPEAFPGYASVAADAQARRG